MLVLERSEIYRGYLGKKIDSRVNQPKDHLDGLE